MKSRRRRIGHLKGLSISPGWKEAYHIALGSSAVRDVQERLPSMPTRAADTPDEKSAFL
jgi:hypothetical protein